MKPFLLFSALLLPLLAGLAGAAPQGAVGHAHGSSSAPEWSQQTLRAFEALPIQDGGRVKPLRTYADFTLLRLNGKRSFLKPDAASKRHKSTPSEWLFDVLLYPEVANHFETFLIPDDEVIQALNLIKPEGKKKRDRYSYAFLAPARQRLREQALQIDSIEPAQRNTTQQHIFELFGSVAQYERLAGALDFARQPFSMEAIPDAAVLFDEPNRISFVEMLERYPDLQLLYATLTTAPTRQAEAERLASILNTLGSVASSSRVLSILPPASPVTDDPVSTEWFTAEDVLAFSTPGAPAADEHIRSLAALTAMVAHREDPVALQEELNGLLGIVRERAESRGEYDKIPLENMYYRAKLITKSLMLFLVAFVVGSLMWLLPTNRPLHYGTGIAAAAGTLYLIAAIVMRCLIRERPPVSTLYETLLFVTAVGATAALIVEFFGRHRIAITAAATLGSAGLFLANGYEKLDKADTMPSLVAVLDTNFYLAIHVTTITIGYSAGILGALLGSVYIVAKALGFQREDESFFANTARMTYGVICFGLIFSIFGTIMGGVWANDSWGRFWGWDPKENGALLICLANIAILHLRAGGYVRDLGLCIAAAFTGIVVVFSWFHVNQLGVGLHSYGFTSGIMRAITIYYAVQGSIVGLGALVGLMQRTLDIAPATTPERVQLENQSS